jgi:uncharacterized SAM-binding protein YcdF (DUF218 family)
MKRAKLGLLALLILIAAVVAFRGAGRWLTREDSLSQADVIFVLSGSMPYRAEAAAKVFGRGYAPEVWLSRPDSPTSELGKLGIHFVTEEEYNRDILTHEGVPDAAIHLLPDVVVNTEQEVEEAGREMRRAGKSRVILITSPQHTRRVKVLWRKLTEDNPKAIVRAAYEDPIDVDHWWRNTRDIFSVVHELLGLVNAWAGLPVPAHSK